MVRYNCISFLYLVAFMAHHLVYVGYRFYQRQAIVLLTALVATSVTLAQVIFQVMLVASPNPFTPTQPVSSLFGFEPYVIIT